MRLNIGHSMLERVSVEPIQERFCPMTDQMTSDTAYPSMIFQAQLERLNELRSFVEEDAELRGTIDELLSSGAAVEPGPLKVCHRCRESVVFSEADLFYLFGEEFVERAIRDVASRAKFELWVGPSHMKPTCDR